MAKILYELDDLRLVTTRRGSSGGSGVAGGRHVHEPTELGARACRSPLPVLWAARAVRALKASWGESGALRAVRFYPDIGAEGAPAAAAGGAEEEGPGVPPHACLYAAGGKGPGALAPQIIEAKAAAAGRARTLLHLADLLRAEADSAGSDMSEEQGRAAIQHMSSSFEAAADLLGYCVVHSERKRARFLVDHLAKDVLALQETFPQGGPLPPARSGRFRRDAEADGIDPAKLAKHRCFAFSPAYASAMEVAPAPRRPRERSTPAFDHEVGDLLRLFEADARMIRQRGALVEMRAV